jgi:hypothetical protein
MSDHDQNEPTVRPPAAEPWGPPAEELDSELAPRPAGRHVAVVTAALARVANAVLAFAGGVLVQRHESGSTTVAAASGRDFARTGSAGGPRVGGGAQGRVFGAPVTGTVVSVTASGTLVIKKSDGSQVTVKVPSDIRVTKSTSEPITSLGKGSTVSVLGSTGADGTVTARTVVAGELGAGFLRGGAVRTAAPTNRG